MGKTTKDVYEQAAGGQLASGISVDRENNMIRNVVFLGAESPTHQRTYTESALREAAEAYDGLAIYVDGGRGQHEDTTHEGRSSPFSLLGKAVNVKYDSESGKVRGDVEVVPQQADFIFPIAESLPVNGPGFSPKHAVAVSYENGKEIVESVVQAYQIDLVTHPSTVRGLAESERAEFEDNSSESEESIMNRKELESKHPEIVQAIESEAREPLEERVEALEEEKAELKEAHESAKEELDELRTEKRLQEKRENIEEKISESALPDEAVTDTFIEGLMRAESEDDIDEQIEDRVELVTESTRTRIPERSSTKGGDGDLPADDATSEHAANLR